MPRTQFPRLDELMANRLVNRPATKAELEDTLARYGTHPAPADQIVAVRSLVAEVMRTRARNGELAEQIATFEALSREDMT